MTDDRRLPAGFRPLGAAVMTAAALLLAACAGDEERPPPCPALVVVNDASNMTRFQGEGRDLTDVLFETEIRSAAISCDYDDSPVEASLRVLFETTRGPADNSRAARFRYFVLLSDRERNLLPREQFPREEFEMLAEFPGNRTEVQQADEIDLTIPLGEGKNGGDYVVYLGLILSRDEVEYNRRNAR